MKPYTTSQRLRQIMDERGLKQVDILRLAKPYCEMYNVKLSKGALNQYLSGVVKEPRNDKLSVLAFALGVSEAWLMGFDVPLERTTPIPGTSEDGRRSRLLNLYDRLTDSEQDEIISLIEWKLSKK